jgi:hypothetical protein
MSLRDHWIGAVSKEQFDTGIAGSFAQVNHVKAGLLQRMRAREGFGSH